MMDWSPTPAPCRVERHEAIDLLILQSSPTDPPVSLCVADLPVQLTNLSDHRLAMDLAYRDFLEARPGGVLIEIQPGSPDLPDGLVPVTFAEGYWSIARHAGQLVFRVYHRESGDLYETLVFDAERDRGAFFYHPEGADPDPRGLISPLGYPLDFLLYSKLLLDRRSVLLHGCAVIHENRCFVFSGKKSAGKSTTARLWLGQGASILNEEQIVLRAADQESWIHGSPWYGETRHCLNRGAPIEAIFLIEHGHENRATRLEFGDAVKSLFTKLFLATFFKEEVPLVLNLCEEIASRTPVYKYAFVPDERAVDYVLGLH